MIQSLPPFKQIATHLLWVISAGLLIPLTGCGTPPQADAESQPQRHQSDHRPAAVDVAIARSAPLQQDLEYTGTTRREKPFKLPTPVSTQNPRQSADKS